MNGHGDTAKRVAELSQENGIVVGPKLKKICVESLKEKGIITGRLSDGALIKKLKALWNKDVDVKAEFPEGCTASKSPFPFVEIQDLLLEPKALVDLQKSVEYEEKLSDLFHFNQSCDLLTLPEGHPASNIVQAFSNYFKNELLPAIKDITGISLNGELDIFASQYKLGDYLLCHDDELESRRIAFILYMSEQYEESFGGTLDLFTSTESQDGILNPGEIVRSVIPKFNKLVFFEVTARSFHQVSEVVSKEADRRALSGWFYGEPLPRPIILPPEQIFKPVDFLSLKEASLDQVLSPAYMEKDTLEVANSTLSENSEIMLQSFFQEELYETLTKKLDSIEDSSWIAAGPANIQRFQEIKDDHALFPKDILDVFRSTTFLQFLEELTEFAFASEPSLNFRCSLKKFSAGCYTLVRGKVRKTMEKSLDKQAAQHKTSNGYSEEEDDFEDEYAEADSEEDEERDIENGGEEDKIENGDKEVDIRNEDEDAEIENGDGESASKAETGNSDTDQTTRGEEDPKPAEVVEQAGTSKSKEKKETTRDDISDDEFSEGSEGSDKEEELEPNRVDVMFFITPTLESGKAANGTLDEETNGHDSGGDNKAGGWKEEWGGSKVYTDDLTGNQLVKLNPVGNALAIVVRDESISSHYAYINCLSGSHYFYSFELEFNFPK